TPPVFGSVSLDWGLAEWHPVGCSGWRSALSDESDRSGGEEEAGTKKGPPRGGQTNPSPQSEGRQPRTTGGSWASSHPT
ncbi:hypothetical protein, partial [uncultured Porphyromonas sp.]|uniref:hypothetical protein n=1 Tax=uncultured Porphyromonas sp. TaxID=159274 RepID=UPI00259BE7CF